jgi:hypothetical protein
MVIILPFSLQAQSPDAAMLHSNGLAQVNGHMAPSSLAIFPDDRVQTPQNAEAKLDAAGSTVVIGADTLVQFDGNQLYLEHGTVQVTTSTEMIVHAGCIRATPAVIGWTQYVVTDVDGKVVVAAHKNDVNIERGNTASRQQAEDKRSEKVTVREGEQATREEKCAAGIRPPDYVAGKAAFFNTWEAIGVGGAAVAVIACLGLCHGDDPASPSNPAKH